MSGFGFANETAQNVTAASLPELLGALELPVGVIVWSGMLFLIVLLFGAVVYRVYGVLLAAAVNLLLSTQKAQVHVGTVSVALLGGKLVLGNVHYLDAYMYVHVEQVMLTMCWWTSQVHATYESAAASAESMPFRLSLGLRGLHLVLLNSRQAGARPLHPSAEEAPANASASGLASSFATAAMSGGPDFVLEHQAQPVQSSLPWFLQFAPVTRVSVKDATVCLSNRNLPTSLHSSVAAATALLYCEACPSAQRALGDKYRLRADVDVRGTQVRFLPNPRYQPLPLLDEDPDSSERWAENAAQLAALQRVAPVSPELPGYFAVSRAEPDPAAAAPSGHRNWGRVWRAITRTPEPPRHMTSSTLGAGSVASREHAASRRASASAMPEGGLKEERRRSWATRQNPTLQQIRDRRARRVGGNASRASPTGLGDASRASGASTVIRHDETVADAASAAAAAATDADANAAERHAALLRSMISTCRAAASALAEPPVLSTEQLTAQYFSDVGGTIDGPQMQMSNQQFEATLPQMGIVLSVGDAHWARAAEHEGAMSGPKIRYGAWHDRQRRLLQAYFAPLATTTRAVFVRKEQAQRLASTFLVAFRVLEPFTLAVPYVSQRACLGTPVYTATQIPEQARGNAKPRGWEPCAGSQGSLHGVLGWLQAQARAARAGPASTAARSVRETGPAPLDASVGTPGSGSESSPDDDPSLAHPAQRPEAVAPLSHSTLRDMLVMDTFLAASGPYGEAMALDRAAGELLLNVHAPSKSKRPALPLELYLSTDSLLLTTAGSQGALSAQIGPVVASLQGEPSPLLYSQGLRVVQRGLYPAVWNALYQMRVAVTIQGATCNLTGQMIDCVSDCIADWAAPMRWPYLPPSLLLGSDNAQVRAAGGAYFLPYATAWEFSLPDAALTLHANPDNIVDVPGDARANRLVHLLIPQLTARVRSVVSAHEQDKFTTHFEVSAAGRGAERTGAAAAAGGGGPGRRPPVPGRPEALQPSKYTDDVMLYVSLPQHHPRAMASGVCPALLPLGKLGLLSARGQYASTLSRAEPDRCDMQLRIDGLTALACGDNVSALLCAIWSVAGSGRYACTSADWAADGGKNEHSLRLARAGYTVLPCRGGSDSCRVVPTFKDPCPAGVAVPSEQPVLSGPALDLPAWADLVFIMQLELRNMQVGLPALQGPGDPAGASAAAAAGKSRHPTAAWEAAGARAAARPAPHVDDDGRASIASSVTDMLKHGVHDEMPNFAAATQVPVIDLSSCALVLQAQLLHMELTSSATVFTMGLTANNVSGSVPEMPAGAAPSAREQRGRSAPAPAPPAASRPSPTLSSVCSIAHIGYDTSAVYTPAVRGVPGLFLTFHDKSAGVVQGVHLSCELAALTDVVQAGMAMVEELGTAMDASASLPAAPAGTVGIDLGQLVLSDELLQTLRKPVEQNIVPGAWPLLATALGGHRSQPDATSTGALGGPGGPGAAAGSSAPSAASRASTHSAASASSGTGSGLHSGPLVLQPGVAGYMLVISHGGFTWRSPLSNQLDKSKRGLDMARAETQCSADNLLLGAALAGAAAERVEFPCYYPWLPVHVQLFRVHRIFRWDQQSVLQYHGERARSCLYSHVIASASVSLAACSVQVTAPHTAGSSTPPMQLSLGRAARPSALALAEPTKSALRQPPSAGKAHSNRASSCFQRCAGLLPPEELPALHRALAVSELGACLLQDVSHISEGLQVQDVLSAKISVNLEATGPQPPGAHAAAVLPMFVDIMLPSQPTSAGVLAQVPPPAQCMQRPAAMCTALEGCLSAMSSKLSLLSTSWMVRDVHVCAHAQVPWQLTMPAEAAAMSTRSRSKAKSSVVVAQVWVQAPLLYVTEHACTGQAVDSTKLMCEQVHASLAYTLPGAVLPGTVDDGDSQASTAYLCSDTHLSAGSVHEQSAVGLQNVAADIASAGNVYKHVLDISTALELRQHGAELQGLCLQRGGVGRLMPPLSAAELQRAWLATAADMCQNFTTATLRGPAVQRLRTDGEDLMLQARTAARQAPASPVLVLPRLWHGDTPGASDDTSSRLQIAWASVRADAAGQRASQAAAAAAAAVPAGASAEELGRDSATQSECDGESFYSCASWDEFEDASSGGYGGGGLFIAKPSPRSASQGSVGGWEPPESPGIAATPWEPSVDMHREMQHYTPLHSLQTWATACSPAQLHVVDCQLDSGMVPHAQLLQAAHAAAAVTCAVQSALPSQGQEWLPTASATFVRVPQFTCTACADDPGVLLAFFDKVLRSWNNSVQVASTELAEAMPLASSNASSAAHVADVAADGQSGPHTHGEFGAASSSPPTSLLATSLQSVTEAGAVLHGTQHLHVDVRQATLTLVSHVHGLGVGAHSVRIPAAMFSDFQSSDPELVARAGGQDQGLQFALHMARQVQHWTQASVPLVSWASTVQRGYQHSHLEPGDAKPVHWQLGEGAIGIGNTVFVNCADLPAESLSCGGVWGTQAQVLSCTAGRPANLGVLPERSKRIQARTAGQRLEFTPGVVHHLQSLLPVCTSIGTQASTLMAGVQRQKAATAVAVRAAIGQGNSLLNNPSSLALRRMQYALSHDRFSGAVLQYREAHGEEAAATASTRGGQRRMSIFWAAARPQRAAGASMWASPTEEQPEEPRLPGEEAQLACDSSEDSESPAQEPAAVSPAHTSVSWGRSFSLGHRALLAYRRSSEMEEQLKDGLSVADMDAVDRGARAGVKTEWSAVMSRDQFLLHQRGLPGRGRPLTQLDALARARECFAAGIAQPGSPGISRLQALQCIGVVDGCERKRLASLASSAAHAAAGYVTAASPASSPSSASFASTAELARWVAKCEQLSQDAAASTPANPAPPERTQVSCQLGVSTIADVLSGARAMAPPGPSGSSPAAVVDAVCHASKAGGTAAALGMLGSGSLLVSIDSVQVRAAWKQQHAPRYHVALPSVVCVASPDAAALAVPPPAQAAAAQTQEQAMAALASVLALRRRVPPGMTADPLQAVGSPAAQQPDLPACWAFECGEVQLLAASRVALFFWLHCSVAGRFAGSDAWSVRVPHVSGALASCYQAQLTEPVPPPTPASRVFASDALHYLAREWPASAGFALLVQSLHVQRTPERLAIHIHSVATSVHTAQLPAKQLHVASTAWIEQAKAGLAKPATVSVRAVLPPAKEPAAAADVQTTSPPIAVLLHAFEAGLITSTGLCLSYRVSGLAVGTSNIVGGTSLEPSSSSSWLARLTRHGLLVRGNRSSSRNGQDQQELTLPGFKAAFDSTVLSGEHTRQRLSILLSPAASIISRKWVSSALRVLSVLQSDSMEALHAIAARLRKSGEQGQPLPVPPPVVTSPDGSGASTPHSVPLPAGASPPSQRTSLTIRVIQPSAGFAAVYPASLTVRGRTATVPCVFSVSSALNALVVDWHDTQSWAGLSTKLLVRGLTVSVSQCSRAAATACLKTSTESEWQSLARSQVSGMYGVWRPCGSLLPRWVTNPAAFSAAGATAGGLGTAHANTGGVCAVKLERMGTPSGSRQRVPSHSRISLGRLSGMGVGSAAPSRTRARSGSNGSRPTPVVAQPLQQSSADNLRPVFCSSLPAVPVCVLRLRTNLALRYHPSASANDKAEDVTHAAALRVWHTSLLATPCGVPVASGLLHVLNTDLRRLHYAVKAAMQTPQQRGAVPGTSVEQDIDVMMSTGFRAATELGKAALNTASAKVASHAAAALFAKISLSVSSAVLVVPYAVHMPSAPAWQPGASPEPPSVGSSASSGSWRLHTAAAGMQSIACDVAVSKAGAGAFQFSTLLSVQNAAATVCPDWPAAALALPGPMLVASESGAACWRIKGHHAEYMAASVDMARPGSQRSRADSISSLGAAGASPSTRKSPDLMPSGPGVLLLDVLDGTQFGGAVLQEMRVSVKGHTSLLPVSLQDTGQDRHVHAAVSGRFASPLLRVTPEVVLEVQRCQRAWTGLPMEYALALHLVVAGAAKRGADGDDAGSRISDHDSSLYDGASFSLLEGPFKPRSRGHSNASATLPSWSHHGWPEELADQQHGEHSDADEFVSCGSEDEDGRLHELDGPGEYGSYNSDDLSYGETDSWGSQPDEQEQTKVRLTFELNAQLLPGSAVVVPSVALDIAGAASSELHEDKAGKPAGPGAGPSAAASGGSQQHKVREQDVLLRLGTPSISMSAQSEAGALHSAAPNATAHVDVCLPRITTSPVMFVAVQQVLENLQAGMQVAANDAGIVMPELLMPLLRELDGTKRVPSSGATSADATGQAFNSEQPSNPGSYAASDDVSVLGSVLTDAAGIARSLPYQVKVSLEVRGMPSSGGGSGAQVDPPAVLASCEPLVSDVVALAMLAEPIRGSLDLRRGTHAELISLVLSIPAACVHLLQLPNGMSPGAVLDPGNMAACRTIMSAELLNTSASLAYAPPDQVRGGAGGTSDSRFSPAMRSVTASTRSFMATAEPSAAAQLCVHLDVGSMHIKADVSRAEPFLMFYYGWTLQAYQTTHVLRTFMGEYSASSENMPSTPRAHGRTAAAEGLDEAAAPGGAASRGALPLFEVQLPITARARVHSVRASLDMAAVSNCSWLLQASGLGAMASVQPLAMARAEHLPCAVLVTHAHSVMLSASGGLVGNATLSKLTLSAQAGAPAGGDRSAQQLRNAMLQALRGSIHAPRSVAGILQAVSSGGDTEGMAQAALALQTMVLSAPTILAGVAAGLVPPGDWGAAASPLSPARLAGLPSSSWPAPLPDAQLPPGWENLQADRSGMVALGALLAGVSLGSFRVTFSSAGSRERPFLELRVADADARTYNMGSGVHTGAPLETHTHVRAMSIHAAAVPVGVAVVLDMAAQTAGSLTASNAKVARIVLLKLAAQLQRNLRTSPSGRQRSSPTRAPALSTSTNMSPASSTLSSRASPEVHLRWRGRGAAAESAAPATAFTSCSPIHVSGPGQVLVELGSASAVLGLSASGRRTDAEIHADLSGTTLGLKQAHEHVTEDGPNAVKRRLVLKLAGASVRRVIDAQTEVLLGFPHTSIDLSLTQAESSAAGPQAGLGGGPAELGALTGGRRARTRRGMLDMDIASSISEASEHRDITAGRRASPAHSLSQAGAVSRAGGTELPAPQRQPGALSPVVHYLFRSKFATSIATHANLQLYSILTGPSGVTARFSQEMKAGLAGLSRATHAAAGHAHKAVSAWHTYEEALASLCGAAPSEPWVNVYSWSPSSPSRPASRRDLTSSGSPTTQAGQAVALQFEPDYSRGEQPFQFAPKFSAIADLPVTIFLRTLNIDTDTMIPELLWGALGEPLLGVHAAMAAALTARTPLVALPRQASPYVGTASSKRTSVEGTPSMRSASAVLDSRSQSGYRESS